MTELMEMIYMECVELNSSMQINQDKDQQKQTVQIDRRDKLHKYTYKYQCQFNSMSP